MGTDKHEPGERGMNAAMEFLVDKLKSGQATVADIGIILADTYKQTDHQSFILREQSKAIKGLEDKLDEIEPKVRSLVEDQKRARWIINGIITLVSAVGLTVGGWLYTSGVNLKNALELNDEKVIELAKNEDRAILRRLEEINIGIKDWVSAEFVKKY